MPRVLILLVAPVFLFEGRADLRDLMNPKVCTGANGETLLAACQETRRIAQGDTGTVATLIGNTYTRRFAKNTWRRFCRNC
ncbi:MAG TPA: hypothetical protein VHW69_02960, partial [Rhizomicrobium sp.]|nr:hypothetical protein [Rhizomicrobium sp.]